MLDKKIILRMKTIWQLRLYSMISVIIQPAIEMEGAQFIYLLFLLVNISEANILKYVGMVHVNQAKCRLACNEDDPLCWDRCAFTTMRQNFDETLSIEVVGFSVKGCALLLPKVHAPTIYQVYTQDSQGAWYDQGQTAQNWLNLTPTSMARTRAIKLVDVSKDRVGVMTWPLPAEVTSCTNGEQKRVARAEESQQQQQVAEQQQNDVFLWLIGIVGVAIFGIIVGVSFGFVMRRRNTRGSNDNPDVHSISTMSFQYV
jgi:hypothetical protein